MPIAQLLPPHIKEIAPGFKVRRSLPAAAMQSIGPFLFFDHFGPVSAAAGENHDVGPHPHIGLATVTYLFEGAMDHRDSLGSFQRIEPGAINWMTAGSGIVHSERTPPDLSRSGWRSHGLQLWVGLPQPHEETAPSFQHVPATAIPCWFGDGVKVRVLIGELHQYRSPVETLTKTQYLDIEAAPRSTFVLPARMHAADIQHGCYSVDEAIEVDGVVLPPFTLAALETGKDTMIRAPRGARYVVIGGDPLDGRRHMWWNFVSTQRDRIEQAKTAWRNQTMAQIPGETDWIPLP